MKLQILSDIHLEFGKREFDFSEADVIILAGDIHVGEKGWRWISQLEKDKPVIYILGNHEYYKNSYPKLLKKLRKNSQNSNIHILENESIIFEDVTIHGATMWTDFGLLGDSQIAEMECHKKMNDYSMIRLDPGYSKLKPRDTHIIHNQSRKWLIESLEKAETKKNIIVTHHAPSLKSIPEMYRKELLSSAFASNLENLILEYKPNLWIHGHLHDAFDYDIGDTRIICNPAGYPMEEMRGFREKLIIEI